MMDRNFYINKVKEFFSVHSVCAILGPRQCGKTTLSKFFIKNEDYEQVHIFDLEDRIDLAR